MGNTPTLLLPYPDPTDPADVPTDMNELATRIETVRGAADGLASLDTNAKVPMNQVYAGQPNTLASLDGTGKVPAAQLPALYTHRVCHVSRSTAYTTGSGGIPPAPNWIPFDTARIDKPGGMWAAGSPTRITIPEAGVYMVEAQVEWGPSATGSREIAIYKNRTTIVSFFSTLPTTAYNNQPFTRTSCIADLIANDYLELALGQTAGGNVDVTLSAVYEGLRVWRIA